MKCSFITITKQTHLFTPLEPSNKKTNPQQRHWCRTNTRGLTVHARDYVHNVQAPHRRVSPLTPSNRIGACYYCSSLCSVFHTLHSLHSCIHKSLSPTWECGRGRGLFFKSMLRISRTDAAFERLIPSAEHVAGDGARWPAFQL